MDAGSQDSTVPGMRLIRALAATLLLSLAAVTPAHAHASLTSTYPADQQTIKTELGKIRLDFNEAVQILPGGYRIVDRAGKEMPVGKATLERAGELTIITVTLDEELPDGWYAVGWNVVSEDGHPRSGAFSFRLDADNNGVLGRDGTAALLKKVADPKGALRPITHATRALGYATVLLTAGAALFSLLVLRRRRTPPTEFEHTARLATRAAVAGVTVVALDWATQTYILYGDISRVASLRTLPQGGALLARAVALLAVTALYAPARKGTSWARAGAASAAVAALGSYALSGHTTVLTPRWLNAASLGTHLLAASAWIGGLVALYATLRRLREKDENEAARIVGRFSLLASSALALLTVAATALAVSMLGDLTTLWSTPYGKALLVKTVLVGALVGLGAYNHYILVPRITGRWLLDDEDGADESVRQQRIDDELTRTRPGALTQLQKVLRVEAAAVVVIAAATALLTSSPAPRVSAAYGAGVSTDDPNYWAYLVPGHVHIPGMAMEQFLDLNADGDTTGVAIPEKILYTGKLEQYPMTLLLGGTSDKPVLRVLVTDSDGTAVKFQSLDVVLEHKKAGVGPLVRNAALSTSGTVWEASAADLQIAGAWEVTVKASVDDFTVLRDTVVITIA